MLKAAKYGYGWVVEKTVVNPTASEEMREWRADLFGYDFHGKPGLIDVTIKNLFAPSLSKSPFSPFAAARRHPCAAGPPGCGH